MTVGDMLREERLRRGLSLGKVAFHLSIPAQEYAFMETGRSAVEKWGTLLANLAVVLARPMSQLISVSGRLADIPGEPTPDLIVKAREAAGKSASEAASLLRISRWEYERIESGETPIQEYGRRMLAFAELIGEPVFNFFYPCGLPLATLSHRYESRHSEAHSEIQEPRRKAWA